MNIYREQILDHYNNPRNFGKLDGPDVTVANDNPLCGDELEIDIKFEEDSGGQQIISDIRHNAMISSLWLKIG